MPTKSPVYHRIKLKLESLYSEIDRNYLFPWLLFNEKGVSIDLPTGKKIRIFGCIYGGSSEIVFWSFINPYLETLIDKTFEESISIGNSLAIPMDIYISETSALRTRSQLTFHL